MSAESLLQNVSGLIWMQWQSDGCKYEKIMKLEIPATYLNIYWIFELWPQIVPKVVSYTNLHYVSIHCVHKKEASRFFAIIMANLKWYL